MKSKVSMLGATAVLAVTLTALPARMSQAAVVEDFETLTLSSGNSIGDASIRTPNYFGISPTSGTHSLLLTTINNAGQDPTNTGNPANQSGTNATTVANIATFLGISSTNIRNTLPTPSQTGQEGSAFKLSLGLLSVGDVVSFNYTFLTQETSGMHRDFAFINLGLGGNTPVVADTLQPPVSVTGGGNPFNLSSGPHSFSFTITTAGTYTLGIGVVDATTSDTPSALLVDDIAVTPIPEPSTIGLGIAGALLLAALRRRAAKA